MAGHKPFHELVKKMPAGARARAQERTREMIVEMLLAEIRQCSGVTQKELAATLGMTQPSLSKIESQQDIRVSTLHRLIESLGGTLELIAHFPSGDVRLTQFSNSAGSLSTTATSLE